MSKKGNEAKDGGKKRENENMKKGNYVRKKRRKDEKGRK